MDYQHIGGLSLHREGCFNWSRPFWSCLISVDSGIDMVEEIYLPDEFSCDVHLSSPRWCTLVGTSWWKSPLTATRWVPSIGIMLACLAPAHLFRCPKYSGVSKLLAASVPYHIETRFLVKIYLLFSIWWRTLVVDGLI